MSVAPADLSLTKFSLTLNSTCGLTSAEHRGQIPSLSLLATLVLVQARMPLAPLSGGTQARPHAGLWGLSGSVVGHSGAFPAPPRRCGVGLSPGSRPALTPGLSTGPAEVTMFPKRRVELGDPNVLTCYVDKFWPPVLSITWLKNGQQVTEGVLETVFSRGWDRTSRKFSSCPSSPGLPTPILRHWGEQGPLLPKPVALLGVVVAQGQHPCSVRFDIADCYLYLFGL
uniref:Ig-like domain-containing protein n=1 Tax=Strix occidentalis caurina TaxID=311401 RepID=A0A8D0F400_STROC